MSKVKLRTELAKIVLKKILIPAPIPDIPLSKTPELIEITKGNTMKK